MKRLIPLTLVAALSQIVATEAPQYLVTSHQPDSITVVDAAGNILRQITAIKHPQDATISPDGRIFCSEIPGAKMFNAQDELIWSYDVEPGTQNPVAQMLENGRFLVGNEGPCRLLEINSEGETLQTIQLATNNRAKHGQFRFCRKTAQGTYLIPFTKEGAVREYNAEGTVVRDFGKFQLPVSVIRIQNGNTLVGSKGRLTEFSATGEAVWGLDTQKDLNIGDAPITGLVRLNNGNTLFGSYHKNREKPDLYEVTPDKQIVRAIVIPSLSKIAAVQVMSE